MTKRSSPAGSDRGRRGAVREGYKVVALLLKPSLGLFELLGRRRVLLPPPTWLHQGITTLFSTSRYTLVLTFKPTSKMWGGMMWPSLETTPKIITVAGNFVFITLGTLNRPDLHFEGAGNGSVVITWISREHCVTFRHDRRLLSLLGFVHNWLTSRWSATKKENRFSLNENGIMSFFLGRQFYRSTLYIYIYIYIYIYMCVCVCVCVHMNKSDSRISIFLWYYFFFDCSFSWVIVKGNFLRKEKCFFERF